MSRRNRYVVRITYADDTPGLSFQPTIAAARLVANAPTHGDRDIATAEVLERLISGALVPLGSRVTRSSADPFIPSTAGRSTMRTLASVTLVGTLTGAIWQPGFDDCQAPIVASVSGQRTRILNGSAPGGRATIAESIDSLLTAKGGDFRTGPRLTADSFLVIQHRKAGAPDGTQRTFSRRVDVTSLPSLAQFVDPETFRFGEDDE